MAPFETDAWFFLFEPHHPSTTESSAAEQAENCKKHVPICRIQS